MVRTLKSTQMYRLSFFALLLFSANLFAQDLTARWEELSFMERRAFAAAMSDGPVGTWHNDARARTARRALLDMAALGLRAHHQPEPVYKLPMVYFEGIARHTWLDFLMTIVPSATFADLVLLEIVILNGEIGHGIDLYGEGHSPTLRQRLRSIQDLIYKQLGWDNYQKVKQDTERYFQKGSAIQGAHDEGFILARNLLKTELLNWPPLSSECESTSSPLFLY